MTFEIKTDENGDWRWRARHENGEIVASNGEGIKNYGDLRTSLHNFMRDAARAEIVHLNTPRGSLKMGHDTDSEGGG